MIEQEKKRDIDPVLAFKQEALQLKSVLNRAIKRVQKKVDKQAEEQKKAVFAPHLAQLADSLLADPSAARRGQSNATIVNTYTQKPETVTLDPSLNAFENVQEMYKKARKGKRGLELIEKLIAKTEIEKNDFNKLMTRIEPLCTIDTIPSEAQESALSEVKASLQELGVLPRQTVIAKKHEEEKVPYRHYTLDQWHVYIGKNDTQNDELTTRFTRAWDIWMHVAGQAGSHVVLRREKNSEWPPRDVLVKVAAFTVWFSKAKHTSYADVNMTEGRFVHKRRHAPPGEVIAERCKTIRVSPLNPQDYFGSGVEG